MLYPFSGLENIDQQILAHAAERGTQVHTICEGIISGLGEIGVTDETWGYVQSFKHWYTPDIKVLQVEKRFWHDELEITGQVDLLIDTPTGLAVVDLKTSSRPSKTWHPQGAAYAFLARQAGHDVKHIYFLHLNKHGKSPVMHEYPVDDAFFLSVLATYKHFYHVEPHETT